MTESQTEPQTVSQVLRSAVAELSAAGVESAAHDARILMAEAINREADIRTTAPVTAMDLVLRGGDPAPPGFGDLLARRVAREPLQLILGVGTVVGLDLPVAPGLFIPRPETDLLIEWAAGQVEDRVAVVTGASDSLTARLSEPSVTVIDLCSGPGTVTLGLAHLLTTRGIADRVDLRLVGLEIDPAAVTAATQATASWVDQGFISNRIAIEFHQADVSTPAPLVRHGLVAAADVVVSNPPYVPESTEVSPEVRQDPHRAVLHDQEGHRRDGHRAAGAAAEVVLRRRPGSLGSKVRSAAGEAELDSGHRQNGHAVGRGNGFADDGIGVHRGAYLFHGLAQQIGKGLTHGCCTAFFVV